jgi:hypothetical protein
MKTSNLIYCWSLSWHGAGVLGVTGSGSSVNSPSVTFDGCVVVNGSVEGSKGANVRPLSSSQRLQVSERLLGDKRFIDLLAQFSNIKSPTS